jgi:hypothetical protein
MTNWLLSLLMLTALASGTLLQARGQTRDQLKDGPGVNCTCPCK